MTLYGQECLAQYRGNPARDPHRQTESKKVTKFRIHICAVSRRKDIMQHNKVYLLMLKNLRIERFWVEVNARVNYPIKNALRQMEEDGFIDMEIEETKFCVSSVCRKLAVVGLNEVVQSWNWHTIPGTVHICCFPYCTNT